MLGATLDCPVRSPGNAIIGAVACLPPRVRAAVFPEVVCLSYLLDTGAPGQSTPVAVPHSHMLPAPQQYSEIGH